MTGRVSFDLQGKRALITGASGLLGQEHAAALAELGAEIFLTDIHQPELDQAVNRLSGQFPGKIHDFIMDVTEEASIHDLAQQLGKMDILVNNAAIDPKVSKESSDLELSRFEHFSLEAWDKQIAVGLSGAFLCSRIFGSTMAERGSGVILNIASDLSVIAPDQRLYRQAGLVESNQPVKPVSYSVIKTALLGLTRYLAAYWADKGVRVNALSPGGVLNQQPKDFVDKLSQLIPLGRMAHLAEYRGAVQFLCSDASSYMTGQNLVVDGGRSII